MLRLTIKDTTLFNERTNEFIEVPEQIIEMEHSLISISKWESKWKKAYLSSRKKTYEELIDYMKCMTITKNVREEVYKCLTNSQIEEINNYISDPMTASCFMMDGDSSTISKDVVTSELIYYWMISFNIPFECQKWHLNKLLALIKMCEVKSPYRKKRTNKEIMKRNADLNEKRRKLLETRG